MDKVIIEWVEHVGSAAIIVLLCTIYANSWLYNKSNKMRVTLIAITTFIFVVLFIRRL